VAIYKKSASYIILSVLEKTVDGLVRFDDMVYNSHKYMGGMPHLKKSTLSEAIRRLRDGGYIEKEVNQGKILLRLTNLGREYLGKDEEWDGKFRLVIWDIPENKRRIRDLFRRRLKEWGFKSWQRSVWVSKKNVTEKLRNLIKELGVGDWVAVIESDDPSLVHIRFNDR
jgi:phenylacetic acid degradation operon negative regulatory protein